MKIFIHDNQHEIDITDNWLVNVTYPLTNEFLDKAITDFEVTLQLLKFFKIGFSEGQRNVFSHLKSEDFKLLPNDHALFEMKCKLNS